MCKSHDADVRPPSALAAYHSDDTQHKILYDSCCTHHIVTDAKYLMNLVPPRIEFMRMGGNEAHKVEGQGTAVLVGGPLGHVVLQEVLYVPTMVHNLFSRGQAMTRGAKEEADEQGFVLRRPDDFKIILTGDTHGMSELHQTLQVISAEKKGFGNVSVIKPSVWGLSLIHI